MKVEIPVFKRCCICLPLRYGLLAWGYFKMIVDALFIALLSYSLIFTLMMARPNENRISRMNKELIISSIAITVFFADLIGTIVFIVGGHKKNVQLIRVFYFLSMGMWVAYFLIGVTSIVVSIQHMLAFNMHYWIVFDVVMNISFYFVVLVVQTYFLLLLRSEIIKLRNIGDFRFVNNATEAECAMKCEELEGAETEREGV